MGNDQFLSGYRELISATQELSLARDLPTIMDIVKHTARRITGSQGATFVLREGDFCHYADEDAIAPLWKGKRFPLQTCISGWTMLNKTHAAIEDIYVDARIPHVAYRPTFVKSLLMMPIRRVAPIGAIGNYWSERHVPTEYEIELLQSLADLVSIAMQNLALYGELDRRVQELARANHAKDEFLMVLSHELRTPLNAILGWAELMRGGSLRPEQMKAGLTVIERNAIAQSRIISDLFDTSKIVAGKLELTCKPIDLREVVELEVGSQKLIASEKGISLDMEPGDALGFVNGDSDRLRQVVSNILSNALKFGRPNGRVRVSLESDGPIIRLRIADDGEGIDAKTLPHIFERFRQADGSSTRRHGGLGLGLAIAKTLVEAHGGRISAASAGPGQGTTFDVILPIWTTLEPVEALPTTPDQEIPATTGPLLGMKVLAIDDEADTRDFLTLTLKGAGAQVRTAESAARGRELVASFMPQVIICDIGMPGEDGYEFLRKLRADQTLRRIPVIGFTAFVDRSHEQKAYAVGFDRFMTKPARLTDLLEAIGALRNQSA